MIHRGTSLAYLPAAPTQRKLKKPLTETTAGSLEPTTILNLLRMYLTEL